jgi:hypothetical protein
MQFFSQVMLVGRYWVVVSQVGSNPFFCANGAGRVGVVIWILLQGTFALSRNVKLAHYN